jgi:hypothetical protein
MFYGLSKMEDYFKDSLNLFVALAPCVKLSNTKSKRIKYLSKYDKLLASRAANLGIKEITGKGWEN